MELNFRKDASLLANIVDAMAVGVFTVDAEGRFVAWSEGAARITGYTHQEITGQACHILEGPNCKGFGTLAELLKSPQPPADGICNQECKVQAKDGRELHIHGSVRLLKAADEKVVGAVGSFIDVTSLVHANQKIAHLEQQVGRSGKFGSLLGKSPVMQEVFRRLKLAADSDVAVLVTGESGTGKELAARALHAASERRKGPFQAINCSAIPDSLLESELFGHIKGAFTGATVDKQGLFEAADSGTLFLDEIGDVSPAVQVKLLRALQEREVRKIGDTCASRVDIRLVTATNRNLRQLLAKGELREDFYYRINVFEIRMPPLRERRTDIPLLVDHFIDELSRSREGHVDGVARDALDRLVNYTWPGNVRQLRNAVEYACVTAATDRITELDLPPDVRGIGEESASETAGKFSSAELDERQRIVAALRETGGNRTKAAALLGTSRVTLWKKIGRYGIEADR